jgi:hypothetical protein
MTQSEAHILRCLTGTKRGMSIAQMWKAEPWWLKINLLSGGLYLAAMRLEQSGKIKGAWIDGPYPRRKIYYRAPG